MHRLRPHQPPANHDTHRTVGREIQCQPLLISPQPFRNLLLPRRNHQPHHHFSHPAVRKGRRGTDSGLGLEPIDQFFLGLAHMTPQQVPASLLMRGQSSPRHRRSSRLRLLRHRTLRPDRNSPRQHTKHRQQQQPHRICPECHHRLVSSGTESGKNPAPSLPHASVPVPPRAQRENERNHPASMRSTSPRSPAIVRAFQRT